MTPASAETRIAPRAAPPGEWNPDSLSRPVILTNGRYTVRLNGSGSGHSEFQNAMVTRRSDHPATDKDGFHIYLRDLDSRAFWSVGYQPVRLISPEYAFNVGTNVVGYTRVDHEIQCHLAICVAPEQDFEIRRCRLTNAAAERRRIEVTSYLEWVLAPREADCGHPAFSKLFVETEFCRERNTIIARRRPRQSDERPLWGFHSIVVDEAASAAGTITFETNRARFIGRGRTLEFPKAMINGEPLSGDVGSVLDPIASLRVAVELDPGETRELAFVLGAAATENELDRSLQAVRSLELVNRVFDQAGAAVVDADVAAQSWQEYGNTHGDIIRIHPPHQAANRQESKFSGGQGSAPGSRVANIGPARSALVQEALLFDNGYGGFSPDGREYVIRVQSDGHGSQRRPPLPWVNVIANEKAGFLVTESGAGCTWSGNSRLNRLTAWHNDPVIDPHSEALWIRDDDAGVFWSPMPGPTPGPGNYCVRHGFGYTTFEHESHGLAHETTVFMDADEPLKLTRCRIINRSGQTRRLSLYSYLAWALGGLTSETSGHIATSFDPKTPVIWASNSNRPYYDTYTAFSALRCEHESAAGELSATCESDSFIGRGHVGAPEALIGGDALDGRDGKTKSPCAAWQVAIELEPGGTFEFTHLLGETVDRDAALELIRQRASARQVQLALDKVTERWNDFLSAIRIETPDREIDLMVNGWLLYQNLSCRMWGRSAYYQPGGAFGFRDQLQDSAAFVYHRPDITRTQILRHAAQQFAEGDVLHWWHPDTGYGVRTRFSDDLLWLPYITAEYVQKSGDEAILNEQLPFISAAPLADGHQESYLKPVDANERASLYEHCCRAFDRGLTIGPNGLPRIGSGDWNDGFSRVGRQGRGESVWLGFFIDHTLERFLPICQARGDSERVERYSLYRERLRHALNTAGWDGAWYRRAYYDNGHPIGSASSDECQIDAIAQSWAVISGVANEGRAHTAMQALEERLVDDDAGMIRLLAPAFNSTPHDPGYIKGYLPGIRENGGQYTHGVLWVVRAMAELGRGTRAVELLRMLSPVWHASTQQKADVYQTEPYVVAADVYGEPPHVGRGGWTWYTGSAGWMFRVAIESIFGFSTERGETIVINPAISSRWPQCRLHYRLPDGRTRYEITIDNADAREHGVKQAYIDGQAAVVENGAARVPLLDDGQVHRVIVRL